MDFDMFIRDTNVIYVCECICGYIEQITCPIERAQIISLFSYILETHPTLDAILDNELYYNIIFHIVTNFDNRDYNDQLHVLKTAISHSMKS